MIVRLICLTESESKLSMDKIFFHNNRKLPILQTEKSLEGLKSYGFESAINVSNDLLFLHTPCHTKYRCIVSD